MGKILEIIDEDYMIEHDLYECGNFKFDYEAFWVTSCWNFYGNSFLERLGEND